MTVNQLCETDKEKERERDKDCIEKLALVIEHETIQWSWILSVSS